MARPTPIIVPSPGLQSDFTQGSVDLGAIVDFFKQRKQKQEDTQTQGAIADFLIEHLAPSTPREVRAGESTIPGLTFDQQAEVGATPQQRGFIEALVRQDPTKAGELARGVAFPETIEQPPSSPFTDIDDFVRRADEEAKRTTGVGLTPGAKNKAALEFKRAQAEEVRATKFAEAEVDIETVGEIKRLGELGTRLAQISTAGALAKAKGEITPAEKITNAKSRMTGNLAILSNHFIDLNKLNAIVNTENPSFDNILASAKSSSVGQAFGTILGTDAQSIRNSIKKLKPLLIQDIRQSTDMGARGLDSEKELEFYLQAASDEKTDIQSNIAAIVVLDEAFGNGEIAEQLRDLTDESLVSRISREGQVILGGGKGKKTAPTEATEEPLSLEDFEKRFKAGEFE